LNCGSRESRTMIYGYCRISTKKQSLERQITNITKNYPAARIYKDIYTGTTDNRPEFKKLMKVVQSGDTIVFDSVSRMSRDSKTGIPDYFSLYDRNINLVFLKEPYINTDVYRSSISQTIAATGNEIADCYIEATNKVIQILARQQIKAAFDQSTKEVDDLKQRTKEGIREARAAGKRIGVQKGEKLHVKKKDPAKKKILEYSKDFNGTLTDGEVIKLVELSRNTYYKYKRELVEEGKTE
jgi:DNA invertase Pin-like site-specific DNA recombinase